MAMVGVVDIVAPLRNKNKCQKVMNRPRAGITRYSQIIFKPGLALGLRQIHTENLAHKVQAAIRTRTYFNVMHCPATIN